MKFDKTMKVLFVVPMFEMGGTMVSLNNLLSVWKNRSVQVDVLPLSNKGTFPKNLSCSNILNENIIASSIIDPVSDFKTHKFLKLFFKIFFKISQILKFDILTRINGILGKDYAEYDVIIAYQEGFTTQFVSCLKAKRKIAWIHCDYTNYAQIFNVKDEKHIYERFDSIVCVSNATMNSFIKFYPFFNNKTVVINNTINNELIKYKSEIPENEPRFNPYEVNILSVGRISPIKRFCEIPRIAKSLFDKNCKFHWYIIGGGNNIDEYKKLTYNIELYDCKNYVTYLGEKLNPYFYIRNSEVVVCLSISESFHYVINEAKVLGIPCITTDFPSAYEFIEHSVDGYIVAYEDIASQLYLFLEQLEYKNAKRPQLYDNLIIVEKLESIIKN